jgi:type VI secretion system protein VasJ
MIYETLGITPIAPDCRAGANVRSSVLYESLTAEIEKLSSPSAPGTVDWNRVVENSAKLLGSHGKDLQVACFLAAGLTQIRGFAGCDLAFKILGDLCENFWGDMSPPAIRIKGRRAALEWWLERTAAVLEAAKPIAVAAEELKRTKDRLARLDRILKDKDPDGPSLGRLVSLLSAIPVIEERDPHSASPDRASAPRAEAAPATPDSPENDEKALERAVALIRRIAGKLLEADILNPFAYRLNRLANWAELERPAATVTGKTNIPPPLPQDRETLKTLFAGGDGEAMARFAESRLPEYPFWLDLNRASAVGLGRMGDRAEGALAEIKAAAAWLITHAPGVRSGLFADGSPFADADTLSWLEGLKAEEAGGSTDGRHGGAELAEEVRQEARELLGKGRMLEAAEKLEAFGRVSGSARTRFLSRLYLCESLLAGGGVSNIDALAAPLLDEIEAHRLELWEPALASRALEVVYRATPSEPEAAGGLPGRAAVLRRLARIDYARALRLGAS